MDPNAISDDVVRPEIEMESAAAYFKVTEAVEEGIDAAAGAATQLESTQNATIDEGLSNSQVRPGAVSVSVAAPKGKGSYTAKSSRQDFH
jgi:hypothetical protein